MAIKRRITPDPDSQYRLCRCGCDGEAEYIEFDTGFWCVACKACHRRGKLHRIRHRVQVNWNGGERHG